MTRESVKKQVESETEPSEEWSVELQALWCVKHDRWHDAHDLVQDLPTAMGSWIHAHLHLIEGDLGNAGYWYSRAGKPAGSRDRIDEEWDVIAAAALEQA